MTETKKPARRRYPSAITVLDAIERTQQSDNIAGTETIDALKDAYKDKVVQEARRR
jgi:hypothetical protein